MSESVHFSIDGKWLADFSRTRVEEGDYQHALRILDCLEGMSLEDKISILKGDKDLEGTNQLNLIDGDDELKQSVKDFYNYRYGSLVKFENRYYEPYMIVTSWCLEDLPEDEYQFSPFAKKFTHQFEPKLEEKMFNMFGGSKLKGFPHSRSVHYAENPREDLAYTFKISDYKNLNHNFPQGVMLFKEFKEQIPFWVDSFIKKTPLEAIYTAIESKHYFSISGADDLYQSQSSNSPLKLDNPYVYGESYSKINSEEEEQDAINDLTRRIKEYADNDKEYGWKTFTDEEGNTLKVPGRAFMHFALKRCSMTSYGKGFSEIDINLPEYNPFAKSGLKMGGDDPYHTDCWLGAGFNLEHAYDHDSWQNKLFMDSIWKLQYEELDLDFNIITSGNNQKVFGFTVNTHNYETIPKGQRILIIPNLSVDFEQAFFQCDHIICETGGKLAHLATLAREFNKSIIRIENATLKFIRKNPITIDFINGTIDYDTNYKHKINFKN